jgi:competence protein ComEC
MRRILAVTFLFFLVSVSAGAQDAVNPDECVPIRVLDCGQGLCCLVEAPDGHYMVYDAGTYHGRGKQEIYSQLLGWVPDRQIDYLVISHPHEDHMNCIPSILSNFEVDTVIRTGIERGAWWWTNTDNYIDEHDINEINLSEYDEDDLPFGETFELGTAELTLVCGWGDMDQWDDCWSSDGDLYNSTSIVMRLEYEGHSVLFMGDSNGCDPDLEGEDCVAAEYFMVHNCADLIDTDVLIAGHHGSATSSSETFINAASPDYVIFSAGHFGAFGSNYHHPNYHCADRFTVDYGMDPCNMYRTDWGDDEGGDEWWYGRCAGNEDEPCDDSVDIWLFPDEDQAPRVDWERNDNDPHLRCADYE